MTWCIILLHVYGYDEPGTREDSPIFSCLMKINLQKAYDTVDWDFLKEMMQALRFPNSFTSLVMECVTTPMFSLMLNGQMEGFFKSSRGLRQGDPISPLLFVICMEYLSRILTKLGDLTQFQFHPRCREMKLIQMCFADDLIMCCKGDYASVYLMLKALISSSFVIHLDYKLISASQHSTLAGCLQLMLRESKKLLVSYNKVFLLDIWECLFVLKR